MARFRHLRKANDSGYDWRQIASGPVNVFRAALENGHNLHVWQFDNPHDIKRGWSWAITDPSLSQSGEKRNPHPDAVSHTWLAAGGEPAASHNYWIQDMPEGAQAPHDRTIPTREEAQREAEQNYQKMFPLGTDTGGHDSGVNYDINDIMNRFKGGEL